MKNDRSKTRAAAFLMALAVLLPLAGCGMYAEPEMTPLTVTLLKVGKADAIVAISGAHALVIDTGEEEDGQEVLEFLQNHGIQEVDAMIISHYDRDHVGGADTILENIPVNTVYGPDYEGTRPEYADFLRAAEATAVPIQRLTEAVTFPFGDSEVLIEPPASC